MPSKKKEPVLNAVTVTVSEIPDLVSWAFDKPVHKSLNEIVSPGVEVELPLAKALQFAELVGVTSVHEAEYQSVKIAMAAS